MKADQPIYQFEDGDVTIRIEQESIQLKAISGKDPVELTESSALKIADCLQKLARDLRANG